MFNRIKKAFSSPAARAPAPVAKPAASREPGAAGSAVQPPQSVRVGTAPGSSGSMWGSLEGAAGGDTAQAPLEGYSGVAPPPLKLQLAGKVMDKPWRIETGRPTRDFILGTELRAKAELDLPDDAVLVLMNRSLKEHLEREAFAAYTDDLQTTVDPKLGEEMRWLSLYEEFAWEGIDEAFWKRFAILGQYREPAMQWLDADMARAWMQWPSPETGPQVPMSFAVMRGKAYMRMECIPADRATVERAAEIFEHCCIRAIRSLGTDLVI